MSPLALFVVFNVIAVPLIGRLIWMAMGMLDGEGHRFVAVGLSLLGAFGILAVNLLLTSRAARAGSARGVVATLYVVTVLTFGLTVGAGFFSPLNLAFALIRG